MIRYLAFTCALMGLVGIAAAQPSLNAEETILSGVQDTSNMLFGSTSYGFTLTTNASDPTYYLNSISINPKAGWDPNITFDIPGQAGISPTLGNGFPANDYTLGDPLGGGQTYFWSGVLNHNGAFNSSIAAGTYNFDAIFQGGLSSSDMNTLADIPLQLEIVNKIDVTESVSYDQQTINQGGTSNVSSTITNNGSRDFVSTTWYISALSQGADSLSGNFLFGPPNWFNQTVAVGTSLTIPNSSWTASASQTPGTYTGSTGVVGGLYTGDNFYFGAGGNTSVNVVPEPSSFLALAGFGVLALRRRKK